MTDMEAIRRLTAVYADGVCQRDAEKWGSTWASDGVWDMGQAELSGPTMVETWSGMMAGFERVAHVILNGTVDFDGDTAEGRWYICEYLKMPDTVMCMWGYYDDQYKKENGEWKFARRKLSAMYQGSPDMVAGNWVTWE